ncbi:hypothetical protein SUDANB19_01891 [Streptomyces sp. enrichment culture]
MSVLVAIVGEGVRWSVCEDTPGPPSGGTVRVHPRPCGALSPDRAAPETHGRRTAVPGGRPGPARSPLGPATGWGFRLCLVTTAEGMPVAWCPASPGLGEREVMTALLERDHHLIRRGQVILADKGFAGEEFEAFVSERLGAHLVRPDRKDEPVRRGKTARVRQWIEAVIDTLNGRLSLEQHGGRTPAGVFAPDRTTAPRPRRRHLAQLDHRRHGQTIPDRLRPLRTLDSVIQGAKPPGGGPPSARSARAGGWGAEPPTTGAARG